MSTHLNSTPPTSASAHTDGNATEAPDESPVVGTPRVKGQQRPGAVPARDILRIVVIGIPVMIIAWFFLRWLRGELP